MSRARTGAAVVAIGLTVLTACGGGGGGEADKQPDQILADAVAALRAVKSVHIEAQSTATSGSDAFTLSGDLVAGSGASGTANSQGVTAKFVVTGGKFYLRGRDFFAKFAGDQAAAVVGDRWVIIPSSVGLADLQIFTDTKNLADCLNLDHGTLSKGGTATVDGQETVVLVDKGDKPGTSPGKLYVATSGTAYPLRLQVTGTQSAGTPPGGGKCSSSSSSSSPGSQTGSFTMSRFERAVTITPPPNPLDLSSLGG